MYSQAANNFTGAGGPAANAAQPYIDQQQQLLKTH
jgi:hypothetical protein